MKKINKLEKSKKNSKTVKKERGRFFDFNKEVFSGEIGALLGSALVSFLSSLIAGNEKFVPTFSVVGSILGSTIFFLSAKMYNKKKVGELSIKNMLHDLVYYTPAAALLRILFGYPLLYMFSEFFVGQRFGAFISGALGEFLSFLIFLVLINIYRLVLLKVFKKRI
jgi:uncharacterized membrane protein YeaQ/YmgE (transglycosylase-associated protein family)